MKSLNGRIEKCSNITSRAPVLNFLTRLNVILFQQSTKVRVVDKRPCAQNLKFIRYSDI